MTIFMEEERSRGKGGEVESEEDWERNRRTLHRWNWQRRVPMAVVITGDDVHVDFNIHNIYTDRYES